MAESVMSPQIQAWMKELESVGRVEIRSSFTSLIWRVGLAVAIVALFILVRFQAGDIGQRGLATAIIGFAALIIGSTMFVRMKYGDKTIVIETDGLITMDGKRIPWTDIEDVSVYSDPRGRAASNVQVNLTAQAWDAHLVGQGAGGKLVHGANKLIARNRAIIMPSYLDAKPHELAAWLNTQASGSQ